MIEERKQDSVGNKIEAKRSKNVKETTGEDWGFNCHVRTWRVDEMKRLQKFVDLAY